MSLLYYPRDSMQNAGNDMDSLVNMSARANAFSIAQLLDSRHASDGSLSEYYSPYTNPDDEGAGSKWLSHKQLELDLEGKYTFQNCFISGHTFCKKT